MTKARISIKLSPTSKKGSSSLSFTSQKPNPSSHVNDSPPPDTPVEASEANCPVMAFRIHDRWLAVRQHLVHQVASFAMPRPLPGKTNDVFLGLVYAAGASYLCFSFYGLLKMTMANESSLRKNGQPRLIVVGTKEEPWAFIMEEMIMTAIPMLQDQEEEMSITTAWGDIAVLQSFDLHGNKVELLDEETLFTVLSRSLVV